MVHSHAPASHRAGRLSVLPLRRSALPPFAEPLYCLVAANDIEGQQRRRRGLRARKRLALPIAFGSQANGGSILRRLIARRVELVDRSSQGAGARRGKRSSDLPETSKTKNVRTRAPGCPPLDASTRATMQHTSRGSTAQTGSKNLSSACKPPATEILFRCVPSRGDRPVLCQAPCRSS